MKTYYVIRLDELPTPTCLTGNITYLVGYNHRGTFEQARKFRTFKTAMNHNPPNFDLDLIYIVKVQDGKECHQLYQKLYQKLYQNSEKIYIKSICKHHSADINECCHSDYDDELEDCPLKGE